MQLGEVILRLFLFLQFHKVNVTFIKGKGKFINIPWKEKNTYFCLFLIYNVFSWVCLFQTISYELNFYLLIKRVLDDAKGDLGESWGFLNSNERAVVPVAHHVVQCGMQQIISCPTTVCSQMLCLLFNCTTGFEPWCGCCAALFLKNSPTSTVVTHWVVYERHPLCNSLVYSSIRCCTSRRVFEVPLYPLSTTQW